MRAKHQIQRTLTEQWLDRPYAKELEAIDDLLTSQPTIGKLAAQDLVRGNPEKGRPGMTGKEVIRALVLKQANQWSYSDQLWDVVRVFTRLMKQAKELTAGFLTITFPDRTCRAKRRYRGAWNAKTKAARREQYRDLLRVTTEGRP